MEKYLIFLTIITFIVIYYCFCNQMKETETFTTPVASGIDDRADIHTLADLARDLNSLTGATMPGNLKVDGSLNVVGSLNFLPRGIIVAWKGSTAPSGWALCDGSNGITPDLRGKFILGQGSGVGLTPRVYDTSGGAETVTLSVAQLPSHTHNTQRKQWATRFAPINANTGYAECDRVDNDIAMGNAISLPTGNNQAHENMPPFYVLAYIMKL
jgi:microcystin-dependent protein